MGSCASPGIKTEIKARDHARDCLTQLWVTPKRPAEARQVDMRTPESRRLHQFKTDLTDFISILRSTDEGSLVGHFSSASKTAIFGEASTKLSLSAPTGGDSKNKTARMGNLHECKWNCCLLGVKNKQESPLVKLMG